MRTKSIIQAYIGPRIFIKFDSQTRSTTGLYRPEEISIKFSEGLQVAEDYAAQQPIAQYIKTEFSLQNKAYSSLYSDQLHIPGLYCYRHPIHCSADRDREDDHPLSATHIPKKPTPHTSV